MGVNRGGCKYYECWQDIVDGGSNREVLSDEVGGEKWVRGDVDGKDGVMNEQGVYRAFQTLGSLTSESGLSKP